MRINVYGEELTYQSELVHKVVDGRNFYGVRMFLESSSFLHATTEDNDQSAVTLWVPWTKELGNDFGKLVRIIDGLRDHALSLVHSGLSR